MNNSYDNPLEQEESIEEINRAKFFKLVTRFCLILIVLIIISLIVW